MRAFIGQFDHVSLGVFGLGSLIGATWFVLLDLGVVLAAAALLIGSVALVTRHRWIEIGLLMVGIGLAAQVGYWIFGPPPIPPTVINPSLPPPFWGAPIPFEVVAPGTAGLLLGGGLLLTAIIGTWDMAEARRRERLQERHELRRARRMQGG
jgi:hypothetical protein